MCLLCWEFGASKTSSGRESILGYGQLCWCPYNYGRYFSVFEYTLYIYIYFTNQNKWGFEKFTKCLSFDGIKMGLFDLARKGIGLLDKLQW